MMQQIPNNPMQMIQQFNQFKKAYMTGQFAYYNPRPVPAFPVPAPYQYGNCGTGCGC